MRYKHSKITARHQSKNPRKAYRFNRMLIILQMLAALVLGFVIWFGIERVLQ